MTFFYYCILFYRISYYAEGVSVSVLGHVVDDAGREGVHGHCHLLGEAVWSKTREALQVGAYEGRC